MADEVKEEQEVKTGGKGKVFLFSGVGLAVVIGAAFLFFIGRCPRAPKPFWQCVVSRGAVSQLAGERRIPWHPAE